jgi:GxxExxY protein
MDENDISYGIRGCILRVYHTLGPGLFETVYCAAICLELARLGLKARAEVALPVWYDGEPLDLAFRLDILVEEKVIIEVKSVEQLAAVHHKQLLTYLKLSGLKLGILVNFNSGRIEDAIFRKVNGL